MDTTAAPTWILLAAAGLVGAVLGALGAVTVLLVFWRPSRSSGAPTPHSAGSEGADVARDRTPAPTDGRRQAAQPEAASDPSAIWSVVRKTVLQAIAERCPAGWTALVLSPPLHPRQMTWHLHLRAEVALDLDDGRTIPTSPPPATHVWSLPSGRKVEQSSGDPAPAPGGETRAVRVSGLHLALTHQVEASDAFLIRVGGTAGSHEYQTTADGVARLGRLLDEGIASAIGDARRGEPAALGYSPASWSAHERAWLHVLGRR